MQTIITAAAIFSMYLNAAENQNSNYYYNADMENGKVTTMYVYTEDGQSLSGKVAYRYEYDEQDRLVKKETMRWDSQRNQWVNERCLELTYTTEGYEVAMRKWDRNGQAYLPVMEKAVYHYAFNQVMAVNYLRRQAEDKDFTSEGGMFVMNPTEGILLASR